MTAKLSRQSVIFLDMVASPDCERRLALNCSKNSKDRRVERALCALDRLDSLFPRTLFSPQLELCSTLPLRPRMASNSRRAPLLVSRSLVTQLMALYDHPHPSRRGRIIRGYDRPHAVRTARMCAAVATALGHGAERVRQYQISCLLHDLGRAGLDRQLFGKIWSWAKKRGIPTRPLEWRALHQDTPYGR